MDDNHSPKNPRFEGGFQINNSKAGPSNYARANKRVASGGCMENELNDNNESEDEWLAMDDICQPGAEKLSFGDFSEVEIRKLTCMQFAEGCSTVINEYGTNMCGSKFDSLAAIEAKCAMLSSGEVSKDKVCQTVTVSGRANKRKELATMKEEVLGTIFDRAMSPSPHHGTQDPPAISQARKKDGRSCK